MEFKMRYSLSFIMNSSIVIIALAMAFLNLFKPINTGILRYNFILWFLIAFMRVITVKSYLPFIWNDKKPVLALEETYLYDTLNNRKYYWKDIKDITKKYDYITLWLHEPPVYLTLFRSGIKRWWANRRLKNGDSPYLINADLVDTKNCALLAVLNEYKKKSQN